MPSGSGQAGHPGSAPRTLEVTLAGPGTRTATPRILPIPAGQPERTEAGRADRCAGPGCSKVLERRATGRPASYCSSRCRQAARRQRVRAPGEAALRVTKPVSKPRSAWEAREQELQRPLSEVLAGRRQELIRRPARELLRMLRQVRGSSDTPETRVLLGDVAAELEERRQDWPLD